MAINVDRGRRRLAAVCAAYEKYRRADGTLPASYEVVHGHAWAPLQRRVDGETRIAILEQDRLAEIFIERRERLGIVVSAMGGMTDALINLAVLAEQDDDSFETELHAIGERYAGTARDLLSGDTLVSVLDAWSADADSTLKTNEARSVSFSYEAGLLPPCR